jgi:hypothetical protein
MATMSVPIVNIRDAVLRALEGSDRPPMEVLTRLGQLGYSDSDIKQAVSELIHEGKIELTPQRMLKIPSQSAA